MLTASKLMTGHGIQAVFSDRSGGCSEAPFDSLNLGFELGDAEENVIKNMTLLCAESGLTTPHQALQVHGINVLLCCGPGCLHDEEADILISTSPRTPVSVRTADCAPILLADKDAGVATAVHAGWKGTVSQVVKVAVRSMCEYGAREASILASIGPCIGLCCFEVNSGIVKQLAAASGGDVSEKRGGKHYANLVAANVLQLLSMGINEEHIEAIDACTVCNQQPDFFSFRREKGKTGRQLSIISLP